MAKGDERPCESSLRVIVDRARPDSCSLLSERITTGAILRSFRVHMSFHLSAPLDLREFNSC